MDLDGTDFDDVPDDDRLTDADMISLSERRARRAGRSGEARRVLGGDPEPVQSMPCRRCRVPVGVTADALHAFQVFSRQLAAQGKPGLLGDQVFLCDRCRDLEQAKILASSRRAADQLALAVRCLRDGGSPEDERLAVECLEAHGYRDTVEHFRQKRAAKPAASRSY